MASPKKYLHDRVVLVLLSLNVFIALLASLLIILRLDPGQGDYIIQYRSNLGVNEFKSGEASAFMSFIVFALFTLAFNIYLSVRAYHIRRHFAIVVLGFSFLILSLSLIVSNALLVI